MNAIKPLNLAGLSRETRLPMGWLRAEALVGRLLCLRVGRKLLFNLAAVQQALAELAASMRKSADSSRKRSPTRSWSGLTSTAGSIERSSRPPTNWPRRVPA
jgi:hypothetical protein